MRIHANAANNKIIEAELSYKLVGIAFNIQKKIGRFCREKQYADVFENELKKERINYKREASVILEDKKSNFVDFIIEDKVLLEFKAKSFIEKEDYFQTKRYLEIANIKLGLIINFRQKHIQPKRVLNSKYNLRHLHAFVASHHDKGFTLTELLITIGIIAIVSIVASLNLFGYRGAQELDLMVQEIAITLRNAQDRSISQESSSRYGIHFENSVSSGGFYDLFSGATYAAGTIISKNSLRPAIQFLDPTSGNSKDVIFAPVSGLPNASTTIIISLKRDASISKTIIINTNGQIQY